MREPIVRLVHERTSPPGVDAGVEPLIAVCATEEEAESIGEASSARGRYASWEHHPLQGAAGRTALVDGEMTHVVLIGDVEAEPRDPIGIAVRTDRNAAEQRAADELRRSGGSGCHAVSLPIGWRADV
ncbi:hypothetical protein FHX42_001583 [Saccharopolyspora lacisalsi]|uniref:Uncharacterized protein n=1 Tax=Halosaccharopolyspora lacisalsi TaxID=1000566 RepID=A0A839DRW5_9PSEU|nr:hypothetical protein [Halosaccharopolyspora lacisalsi]MBA8824254.1 hypothetical protein [Halosaccharopolyspora lacisalsi]